MIEMKQSFKVATAEDLGLGIPRGWDGYYHLRFYVSETTLPLNIYNNDNPMYLCRVTRAGYPIDEYGDNFTPQSTQPFRAVLYLSETDAKEGSNYVWSKEYG